MSERWEGVWKKREESEGEGAGLYGLRSTTKGKSGAAKLYSEKEENGSALHGRAADNQSNKVSSKNTVTSLAC